ncbi:hypothetical protein BZG36_03143 [Bifiguratus adelaidae]|uniref:White collar 1 protein n=1 Tax=Bifiguratus adelaidae TaxID=1938954 RepID=A0A261XXA0_9FUNG|nr:hypothetical protein BZG36_03143 [Bifiguratus adelaidae]
MEYPDDMDYQYYRLPPKVQPIPPSFGMDRGADITAAVSGLDQLSMTAIKPPTENFELSGMYSTTGFDMVTVLSKLVSRPNPQIHLGPIDMSCSFLVVDARQYDFPIVYVSPTFEKLTAYTANEILGRNCRFLQAPDGMVAAGSRRRYTDNAAVFHLKTHTIQGKESQASIINYRKGGQPFINLITIIPITWESDEIAYFVGLQVDLVERPNAILEKMKDGSYMVNYQMTNIPPFIPPVFAKEPVDDYFRDIPTAAPFPAAPEVFQLLGNADPDNVKMEWNKMLLEHADNFVHVISLKDHFLYCSPSCRALLGYEPDEIVGKSLSAICHPSDIVPVMRELKEASAASENFSIVYRIRRKDAGYMWFECQGRMYMEQGKGRKCVILSGKERSVYRLIWDDIINSVIMKEGMLSLEDTYKRLFVDSEFWAKCTLDGLFLHATNSSLSVLGIPHEEMVGISIYQLVRSDRTTDMTSVLSQVKEGKTVNLRHLLQNRKGQYIQVNSTFFPGDISYGVGKPSFMLVQIREITAPISNQRSTSTSSTSSLIPSSSSTSESETTSSGSSTSSSPPPGSTEITLPNGEDNVFEELEPVRSTSWQFELHQLRLTNKKLKEELEALSAPKRKKKKAQSSANEGRICGFCQRRDSPEWRKGPNGPKELCNACGLRYAKKLSLESSGIEPLSDNK